MIIVGLCGFKHSGKTAVARVLERHGFAHYGFADGLREMASAVNPTIDLHNTPPDVYDALARVVDLRGRPCALYNTIVSAIGYERAKLIPDHRRFLQRLGTEGIRATFGVNAWVDLLSTRLAREAPALLAISDVRFHSEYAWIAQRGGLLWRVVRDAVITNDNHSSEREMLELPAERIVYNNGTLEDLETAVNQLVETYQRRDWER